MSKISLSPNALGSGTLTIAAPDTNTDRTLNLPDAAGTVALTSQIPAAPTIASSGEAEAGTNNTNFITPLGMREGFNASGSAPVFACRAWVNFNGSLATPSIFASGNVSSVTKIGTGRYTINMETALPDANYALAGSCVGMTDAAGSVNITSNSSEATKTTTACSFRVTNNNGDLRDANNIGVFIIR